MDRVVGILLVAASAAGFGTLAIFGRYAYADGMDALTISFLRFSLAAVLMLGLLVLRRERLPRGAVLLRLVLMGALAYVAASYAYLTALQYASAGLVAVLLYLYPIFVALLAVLVLREPIKRLKLRRNVHEVWNVVETCPAPLSIERILLGKRNACDVAAQAQKPLLQYDVAGQRIVTAFCAMMEIAPADLGAPVATYRKPRLCRIALLQVVRCAGPTHFCGDPARIDGVGKYIRP